MHFKCVRCARRHSFPAARTGAGGRVPCRCGATLVLEPPATSGLRFSSPDHAEADITTLGYTVTAEARPRFFDGAHAALRAGIGLGKQGAEAPDPAAASRPTLLATAFAASLEPRLWMPNAILAAASLAFPPLAVRMAGGGPGARLLALLVIPLGLAWALARGSTGAALAVHQALVVGSKKGAPRRSGGSGLRRSATAHAVQAAIAVDLAVLLAAMIAKLGETAGPDIVAAFGTPVQAALAVAAVIATLAGLGLCLAHAAEAPRAADLNTAMAGSSARRTFARGAGLLRRPLGPAAAAWVLAVLGLGGVALAIDAAVSHIHAGFAPAPASATAVAVGRTLSRALVLGLTAGIASAFAGVAGLLAGYALGSGAAREPTRRDGVYTGTLGSMQAALDAAPAERIASVDSIPPPADEE